MASLTKVPLGCLLRAVLNNSGKNKFNAAQPEFFERPIFMVFNFLTTLYPLSIYIGEGTFGLVRQAKAEGIVESTPERNIVAVKTTRGNAFLLVINYNNIPLLIKL